MNECYFMGNLTRDVTLKNIGEKAVVANFGLAISRTFKRKDGTKDKETSFIECELWDSGAKTVAERFKKGSKILIRASVKQENWEVDGDGGKKEKRSRLKFRVDKFWFVDSGPRTEEENSVTNNEGNVTRGGNDDDVPF